MIKLKFTIFILLFAGLGFYGHSQQYNQNDVKSEIKKAYEESVENDVFMGRGIKSLTDMADYGSAPALNWSSQFGGSGSDVATEIVSDINGNSYVSGYFSGEIIVSGTTYTSIGEQDGFVAKYDIAGNLIWFKAIPAQPGNYLNVMAIEIKADTAWITGSYTGSVSMGVNLPNDGSNNLFLTSIDANGNFINAYHHYVNNIEIGLGLSIDDSNNVYVLGANSLSDDFRHPSFLTKFNIVNESFQWYREYPYSSPVLSFTDFVVGDSCIYLTGFWEGSGSVDNVTFTPEGYYGEAFVIKSDFNGDLTSGTFADHPVSPTGDSYGLSLDIDQNENVYFAGYFRTNVIFGNDTIMGSENGFVAKYDPLGDFVWGQKLTTTGLDDVAVDPAGSVYVIHDGEITNYDFSGLEQWSGTLTGSPSVCDIDNSGNIDIAGSDNSLVFLSQLDNTGTQNWQVNFGGNSGSARINGMVSDSLGNVYLYGYTSNTTDIFGAEVNAGVFITKQNSSGDLLWNKQLGCTENMGAASQGNSINIDEKNGFVYITGGLTSELVIPGQPNLVPDAGGSIFILKYDLNGNFIWSKQEDFFGQNVTIAPDYSGNIVIACTYFGSINVSSDSFTSSGSDDALVLKYDSGGNYLWGMSAGGENIEYNGLVSIDTSNNIFFSGEFHSENVSVGDSTITLNEGDGNIVLAKIQPDGTVQWVTSTASSTIAYGDYYCWPTGILNDKDGNVYIKGWHGDSASFGNILLTSPYVYNYFISKFDSNGNVLWAKSITEKSWGFDYNQFDIDSEGSVYLGAQATDTLYFGGDYMYTPSGETDLFVAKYMSNGDLSWVKTIEANNPWIAAVAVYSTDNVFVGGEFTGNLSIDNVLYTSVSTHGFLAKFGQDGTGVKEVYSSKTDRFYIYPNPSNGYITLNSRGNMPYEVRLLNELGQIVKTIKISTQNQRIALDNLSQGIYFIQPVGSSYRTEKLIIK